MDALLKIKEFCACRKEAEYKLSARIGSRGMIQGWRRRVNHPRPQNARKLADLMVGDGFLPEAEKDAFLTSLLKLETFRDLTTPPSPQKAAS